MPSFASSIPASGAAGPNSPTSSAAVLEFVCLFTHDLRRKQKRWQDGRLKFHTFNQRVMVYDERGNFIGDMHWRRDYDFDEGEEIQLERGGVMVQVAECVDRREQDLSELIDKRVKEKEERQMKAVARTNASLSARPTPRAPQPDHLQVRHRPLHQLIGTPTGHHGRALAPTESPFEQRHSPNNPPDDQNSRAAKRRKYDDVPSKSGYAQALFGATLSLSATPLSSAPVRPRALPARSPSAEVESREPCQEQVALREQPKSSRHFNSLEKRKKDAEQAPAKRPKPNKPREPPLFAEDISVAAKQQETSETKLPGSRLDRVRQEVVRIEDEEEEEDNDVHQEAQIRDMRQSAHFARPLRQAAEQTPIEEHSKRKSRTETETSQEVSDSEPRRIGQSKITTKPKSIHRGQPQTEQAMFTEVEIAEQRSLLRNATAKKQLDRQPERSDEPRTELRIKPRKKRGLLMMAEPVKAVAPRESVQPALSKGRTVTKTRPIGEKGEEDDPFASSPPRPIPKPSRARLVEGQSVSLMTESTTDNESAQLNIAIDDELEDDVPLRRTARTKTKTSTRAKTRRKTILDDDDDDEVEEEGVVEAVLGEPWKRRHRRSVDANPDALDPGAEDSAEVEAPKEKPRKTRQSKKTREAEEAAVLDSDKDDSTTSRRNSKRITAQGRRRSREDTPAEPAEPAADSDLAETDEIRQPPKKRRRSEETHQVSAGPRLARLSKKGIKSREVIGFRLDDAAMFRGLGTRTGPSIEKAAPEQAVEAPALPPNVETTETDRSASRRNSSVATTAQYPESIPATRLQTIARPEENNSSGEQAAVEQIRETAPERTAEPSGALEASHSSMSPSNDDRPDIPDTADSAVPLPAAAQTSNIAGDIEVDLLEGVTLSPVVLSPVKPSLPIALPVQELPGDAAISAQGLEDTPPVEKKPLSAPAPPPLQRPPSPPPPERRTINGLGRQNSAPGFLQARNNPAEATRPEPLRDVAAAKPMPPPPPAPAVARIVNPATRGRKAALKSHAAGQAPQPVLPANQQHPAGATIIYVERAPPADAAEPPQPRAAKKMTFPGFAPARQSGPWSREAFDLLEKPRPL